MVDKKNEFSVWPKVMTRDWQPSLFWMHRSRQCLIPCSQELNIREGWKNWRNNERCFPIFWHWWSISPGLWLIDAAILTGSRFNQNRIYSRMAISETCIKGQNSIFTAKTSQCTSSVSERFPYFAYSIYM